MSFVVEKESDNLLALYYMGIYWEKRVWKAKSYLNLNIMAGEKGMSGYDIRELSKKF